MEDLDFRVGDKVYDFIEGNGVVAPCTDELYPIKVIYESGEFNNFTKDGKLWLNEKRTLFHGHNIEVIIKEEMPIRTKIKWVFVYLTKNGSATCSGFYDTKEECQQGCTDCSMNYKILIDTHEVEI